MRRILLCLTLVSLCLTLRGSDDWAAALGKMPLGANVTILDRTNCVDVMLRAFQPNAVVKALVFMPGATDEFYFFRRARATLTNSNPSLLDAVTALTNRTHVRATFQPPLLLLHTEEDVLGVLTSVKHQPTEETLRHTVSVAYLLCNDRDWDFLLPTLKKMPGVKFSPRLHSADSWHFYRHSFASWNLTDWEALEAIALAGKTRFTVGKRLVDFEPDRRHGAAPTLEEFPR